MAKINFGGTVEDVITADEFSVKKAQEVLKNEVIAVIGYGVQGPAQAFNMKDNGISIIIGQAQEDKPYWDKAIADGWVPGKTLFPIEEAVKRGTIIQYLVSDAAQMMLWPKVKANLKKGDALYFSHGFSIVYKEQTGVIPPDYVDVIMVAPKGSGHQRAAEFPRRKRHQQRVSPFTRMPPAGPWKEPWRWVLPSVPDSCFPQLFKWKFTATSPVNAACSWEHWPE